ncbi:MAG: T9SS type A sorting domain-containing protein [Ignavibacteriae bacterium]|nr:T9SS type A sorting domain-containing protein [Ignavibacteriota bacterium]
MFKKLTLYFLGVLFFSQVNLYGQAQLVQSFIEENITGNTQFGYSVSNAGDVNDDGYADVIVGAYGYDSDGSAYIYFGGNSQSETADIILYGNGGSFGFSVSGAGDINNDGFDDVIVGAYSYNSSTGRVYVYYGGNKMDQFYDIVLDGGDTIDRFGRSVSKAGDVNGDGYDDIIVGAHAYKEYKGRAFIYFGNNNMDDIADVTMIGEVNSYEFGYSVSNAGDVNNDGYDDVIVGAHEAYSSYGAAYLYLGGNFMNDSIDAIMIGEEKGGLFGRSVSGAGDVNNDGFSDVIIGAASHDFYTGSGRAYIYYGGIKLYYAGIKRKKVADITLMGDGDDTSFGFSVSNAGDVNGDGYDDVIVGAFGYNTSVEAAYIYYGGRTLDSSADVILKGEVDNSNFGYSVSSAGDVNKDGYDDVIIGASQYPPNGKAYIYSGPDAPLPVELISFYAKTIKSSVKITWQTATEVNNYGFEIERKQEYVEVERDDWNKIGFIEGNGNSNSTKEYSFVDDELLNGKILYRLKQIDIDGFFEYSSSVEVDLGIPTKFELYQNYPNPFNPTTTIKYSVPVVDAKFASTTNVTLKTYDILGKNVATLVNKKQSSGNYEVNFDATNLTSGVYYYQLRSGDFVETKKMILLK